MLLLHDKDGYEAIREHLDACLFIEADMELCHNRLNERKVVMGGRDKDDAEQHYQRVDRPNHLRVSSTRHRADLVLVMDSSGCIATCKAQRSK